MTNYQNYLNSFSFTHTERKTWKETERNTKTNMRAHLPHSTHPKRLKCLIYTYDNVYITFLKYRCKYIVRKLYICNEIENSD